MKIFVTGCASFVGKELLRQCKSENIDVVGVDLTAVAQDGCAVADICSPDIADYMPEGVDAVIHLAALSRDSDCRDNAYKCFDINVMGTLNLIEAAKTKGARQFIFASSEWVYDSFQESIAKLEDDIINISHLTSEYALSKLVSEVNLRQKYQHGLCPVTVLRFGIIYGPRKENWSAVESLLHAVATQDEVVVGSVKTGRRFVHVADIATAIIASIGLGNFEIINIQGNLMITLGDILEMSKKLLKRNPTIIERTPNQISLRTVSNEKAIAKLGWKAQVDLEQGLKSIINYLDLGIEP